MTWFSYIQLSQATVRATPVCQCTEPEPRGLRVWQCSKADVRHSPNAERGNPALRERRRQLHLATRAGARCPRNPRNPRNIRKPKCICHDRFTSFHIVSHCFTSFLYNYVILIIFCVDLENCSHGKDDTFDSKEARKFTSRDMWHLLRQAAKEQCDSHLLTFARQGEADIRVLELSACDDCAENIWTLEHLQVFALCAWQSVSWVRRSFRRVCDEHFVTKVEQKSLCLCLSLSQFVLVWQTMKEDSADTKETQRTLMDFKYLYNIAKEDRFVSASCRRRKRSPGLAQPLQKSQGYDNWGASAHGTICES